MEEQAYNEWQSTWFGGKDVLQVIQSDFILSGYLLEVIWEELQALLRNLT